MFSYSAHSGEPLFFALFDLMKWKDYGIMIWYETLFEIAEGFDFGTYD